MDAELIAVTTRVSRSIRPRWPTLDSRDLATDQMLPEVTARPLRARSDRKPGEFTVTPGEANTAPELGRASSPSAGRRPLSW
jgi:hypothetical protein